MKLRPVEIKRHIPQSIIFPDAVISCALLLAAIILRAYHLEGQSLWNDEMFSLNVSILPMTDIQNVLVAHYHHPPLFFYFAHLSLRLFGYFAWALRLPSVVFGALTIPLLYTIGKKFFNRVSGIAGAAICLFAPFHLAYSQEGRPYALAGFLCLLSVYLFIGSLRDFSIRRAVPYILTTVALLYTHHWGIFVLAAEFILAFVAIYKKKANLHPWLIIFFSVGILYLPEFIALRQQITTDTPTAWFWIEYPGMKTLVNLGTAFGGTYFKLASATFELTEPIQIVSLVCIYGLFILSLIDIYKLKYVKGSLFFFLFAAIVAIPLCIAFIKPEVFVWYRYPVIAFPLFCIIAGELNTSSSINKFKIPLIILILVFNLIAIRYYFSWEKGNAKDVAAYVDNLAKENVDFIVRPKEFAPLLNYYYRGSLLQYDETYLDQPLGMMVDTARSFAYISLDVPNGIRDYMNGHFDKIAEKVFPGEAHMGIVVDLYRQKPESDE
jgi:mannosyltransferase